MICHVALIACPTLSLSVPENTPFTAVLKFAAEEVSSWVSLRIWSRQSVMVTVLFLCLVSALQFKVPPATSAIITNGMFISDSHSSLYSVMKPGGMGAWEWNLGVWEPGNEVNISVCSLRARKGLLTCSWLTWGAYWCYSVVFASSMYDWV